MGTSGLHHLAKRYAEALDQDPENAELCADLAEVYRELGRSAQASDHYERAARMFVNLGQYGDAASACREALKVDPAAKGASELLEGLRARGLLSEEAGRYAADDARRIVVFDGNASGSDGTAETPLGGLQMEPSIPDIDVSEPVAAGGAIGEVPAAPDSEAMLSIASDELEEVTSGELPAAGGLFPWLPPDTATCGIQQSVAEGQLIAQEGEPADELFLVIDGAVQLSCSGVDGPVELDTIEAGSFFGEVAILGDGRTHATARALSSCTLLMVPRSHITRLMKRSAEVERMMRMHYRDRLQRATLRRSALFETMHGRVGRRFLKQFRPLRAAAGSVVVGAGDKDPGLYLVMVGTLEVGSPGEGGQAPVVLGELRNGDFFGEMSLLASDPCGVTLTASSFVQLLHLQGEAFRQFAERHPRFKAVVEQEALRWSS